MSVFIKTVVRSCVIDSRHYARFMHVNLEVETHDPRASFTFKLITNTTNLDWLLLTKRAQSIRKMLSAVKAKMPPIPDDLMIRQFRPAPEGG
jgi:hypothetical protein